MSGAIQMKATFAAMAKKELSGAERETQLERDAEILRTAAQYVNLLKQAEVQSKQWLPDVELRHLSGSQGTVYLKKLGHRPLTKGDITTLILLYGNAGQQQLIKSFEKAQIDLSERLEGLSSLGLVLKRADINYNTYYLRSKKPDQWKPEEMISLLTVLEDLKL